MTTILRASYSPELKEAIVVISGPDQPTTAISLTADQIKELWHLMNDADKMGKFCTIEVRYPS